MRSSEHYYAHVQGEQKGPYTFAELKHLFDSGFLPEDSLYWQDGMEQWEYVRDLCVTPEQRKKAARKASKRAWNPMYVAIVVLIVAVLGRLFVPLTFELWQETIQHDFTAKAAYWRARDCVRGKLREHKLFAEFGPFDQGSVQLNEQESRATVVLPCTGSGSHGAGRMIWRVSLEFRPGIREWTATQSEELKDQAAATE
jgi:hypothetical protein